MPTLASVVPSRRPRLLLELDLTQPPVSVDASDPLNRLRARHRPQLQPVLRGLHEAGSDARVGGLVAKVGGRLPWALAQELREGVAAFAATGKPTLAWAESFSEGSGDTSAYLLATGFGEIWLQPGGTLGLLGVGVEATFVRGVLDRLGVEPQVQQRHEYKNAADLLVRTSPSPAHREALERVTESLTEQAVEAIAAARALTPQTVRELFAAGPRTAAAAHAAGLVDRLGYRDEALAAIRDRVGEHVEMLFADRWRPRRRPAARLRRRGRPFIGYVEIRGAIGTGRSRRGPIGHRCGSDTVGAVLRAAGDNDRIRGVVLRVDSPGGSAVASETIWREVCRLRDGGKPVVVSMGPVAASGGYYVACGADVIVALPGTLTGSIGVVGGKLVLRDLLERLGVTTAEVAASPHALMFSPRRRFDPHEEDRVAALIDAVYDDFVAKVAAGRGRPVAEIEPLARGRVWTGADAHAHGLVDELGGLRTALRIARQRAGLPEDAPLRPAATIPPVSRLSRPRNSDDPRAATAALAIPRLRMRGGWDVPLALRLPPMSGLESSIEGENR